MNIVESTENSIWMF